VLRTASKREIIELNIVLYSMANHIIIKYIEIMCKGEAVQIMEQVCFGIDIGGTAVKVGMFNTEGKLLNKWDFATRKTGNGKDILKDSAEFIKGKIKELQLKEEEILGVGVGIPGPVKDNGDVLELANLGLGHFNIEEDMRELTGLKVKAGNDANVAALGEVWMGGGKGYRNMVLVTLGTGVGGGIILNGSVLAGSNGAAGEIGHIFVNEEETSTCGCGKRGCLEQYASATGIVRLAKRFLNESTEASSMRGYSDLSAKAVFDCAKEGDKLALEAVEKACWYLGVAMAHIAQVIDPEVFVIGGGVSKAGDILTEKIKKYYNKYVMDALKNKEFKLATLGNDAGIYGAAKLILA
jgi:glucokinase